jgi:hypothetical protein
VSAGEEMASWPPSRLSSERIRVTLQTARLIARLCPYATVKVSPRDLADLVDDLRPHTTIEHRHGLQVLVVRHEPPTGRITGSVPSTAYFICDLKQADGDFEVERPPEAAK